VVQYILLVGCLYY